MFLIFACEDYKNEKNFDIDQTTFFSPRYLKFQNNADLVNINLDSLDNYSSLLEVMENLSCDDKISALTFNSNRKKYFLTGFAECPKPNTVVDYFHRNYMYVVNDSILRIKDNSRKIKRIPIIKFDKYLEDLIESPEAYNYKKTKLKPALIRIFIDDRYSISRTKKNLQIIAEGFKKINSNKNKNLFEYNILFDFGDFSGLIIPPPPPPMPE